MRFSIWRFLWVTLSVLLAPACSGRKPQAPTAPAPVEAPTPSPPANVVNGGEEDVVSPLSEEEWFRAASVAELEAKLSDVYFDYDRHELRSEARDTLARNWEWLSKSYNTVRLEIEGHCDERGTVAYNLALGDRRATSVADYLVSLGLPRNRLTTVSYGKERPQCRDSREECWSRNRRAHFRVVSKGETGGEPSSTRTPPSALRTVRDSGGTETSGCDSG